jgi:hypothetical protein
MTIGTKSHPIDKILVTDQSFTLFAGSSIPELNRAINTTAGDRLTIGTKGHPQHWGRMSRQSIYRLPILNHIVIASLKFTIGKFRI